MNSDYSYSIKNEGPAYDWLSLYVNYKGQRIADVVCFSERNGKRKARKIAKQHAAGNIGGFIVNNQPVFDK